MIRLIATITAPIWVYLCFVFVSMTPNPQEWSTDTRFFLLLCAFGVVAAVATFPGWRK